MNKVLAVACFLVGAVSGCFNIWILGFIVIAPEYYGPVPGRAWVVPFLVSIFSILSIVVD